MWIPANTVASLAMQELDLFNSGHHLLMKAIVCWYDRVDRSALVAVLEVPLVLYFACTGEHIWNP